MNCDVAIIGGGIAGLSLSIDLARRGSKVILLEKGSYPRHKVCGEYIAMESRDYLYSLCPELYNYKLPQIRNFKFSSTGSNDFRSELDPGGFGISRYLLEHLLYKQAIHNGVTILLHSRVDSIAFDKLSGSYRITSGQTVVTSKLACNATGRKSNLDVNHNPLKNGGTNYVGVKYHVRVKRDPALIEIHNFPGGYCGISDIEENKSCLCYLVNARYLKQYGNSFRNLESAVLGKNPNLKHIFSNADFLFQQPVTVSGINFRARQPYADDLIFLGDAAGSIAPITGNGMSMGMRAAAILAKSISASNNYQPALSANYSDFWNHEFAGRIRFSRYLQKLSEYPLLANLSINVLNSFPGLAKNLINRTHGQPFV